MTSSSETDPTPPSTSTGTQPPSPSQSSNPPNSHSQSDQTNLPPTPTLTNPRLASLATKQSHLTTALNTLLAERATLISTTTLPANPDLSDEERTKAALASANATLKSHMALLHAYNEIKDIGQGLMGMIAEGRGVRVREVMEEMGVGEKD